MPEKMQGLRKSVAGISQSLKAPKTWIGSEGVNVLRVLDDTLDLLQQMNTQLAAHRHPQLGAPPANAAEFAADAAKAALLSAELGSVTL